MTRTSSESLSVSLNFSTIASDGLLLWNSPGDPDRFLGLGIDGGHLKLASHLLGTESRMMDIPTSGFVADGAWHEVTVDVARRQIRLELDGRMIFEETQKEVSVATEVADEHRRQLGNELEHPFFVGK